MNCVECEKEMSLVTVNDDPNKGFAYNVFECSDCMIIAKENVWKNKGMVWVYPDNQTITITLKEK